MQPLEVTGTRSPMDPNDSPLPTAALSDRTLRREQTVSIAHAVEGLPGLRTLGTGAEIGKPVIRGFAGSRVLVLDNGHRLEDYSWSDEDGPSIEVRQAERVEVFRGPASIIYGSDALGGVINAVSEELPDAVGTAPILRGGFETYAASNDMEFGGALRLEGAKGGRGWRLFGVGRYGNNLHTPDGELENTGFFAVNGEAAGGIRGQRGGLAARIAHYGGEFHLLEAGGPNPGSLAKEEEGGPVRKLDDIRVQLDGSRQMGGVRFEMKSQFQRHSLAEVSDEGLPPGDRPGKKEEPKAFDLLLNTVTIDLMAQHGRGPWQGTLGASGSYQSNDSRGPIPLVPDATIGAGGAFAFERVNVGRLGLLGGLRVDRRHTAADANALLNLADQTRDATEVSGNAGAVYRILESISVTGNVGRGWRAPNLFELFANGPHVGEARYELGNADLDPERSLSLDAGVRVRSGRMHAEVSGFRSKVDRFIYITPTDSLIGGLRVYRYRQDEALLVGGEASAEVEVARPLTLRGTVDYVRGDNESLDEPLPLMPPVRGTLRADLHPESAGWLRHSYFGAEVETFAKQTRRSEFDYATKEYTLLNADAGIEHELGGRAWRLDLAVHNAANTRYKSFLSRYKEFAYDQGRNVILRVSTGI
jgi:outer membrane receptor protein involved in Fe transport